MSRYQRQTSLTEVGATGQQRVANAHVLVIGAGGLGCAALPYLVSGGVGHIRLVDADVVSLSNLHRQVLYKTSDIGLPKVDCAKRQLIALNETCQISTELAALTPSNVARLCSYKVRDENYSNSNNSGDTNYDNAQRLSKPDVQPFDIVLDCADNFAVSYILSDYCHTHSLPLISASALGFSGYVGGFCGAKPSLRAVFPELPERAQNCSSAGVMGPVVGTIGCIQAQFALNVLLNMQPSPLGQMLTINLKDLRQSTFRFDDAPEPLAQQNLCFIDPSDVTQDDWVVDLRGEEFGATDTQNTAHKSTQIQYYSLDDFTLVQQPPAKKPPPQPNCQQKRAVIVCRTGLTAWRAARLLQTYWQGKISLIAMGNTLL
jgi:molybdopterin/thiamine biosynthesis adenylyltransferase